MLEDLEASEKVVSAHLQTLTPPPTPRKHQSSHAEELRLARPILPNNRVLTHEVAINKEYRIEEDALQERAEIMSAVFDKMRQEIGTGNSDLWVLAMAENIRTRLQQLLKEGNSMYRIISEALDNELVARELQHGVFSYEKFFTFMASLLPRLCAPFRDEEIKDIVENKMQNGDVVSRLQALMHGIDLMQLDYANFMLQQAAPTLIKNASEYETSCFMQLIEETNGEVPITDAAWRKARTKVYEETARRDPEGVNLFRSRPTPEKIYAHMLVDVFTSLDPTIPIPETLQLDSKRIQKIQTDILHIATTGAILLQCKNLLKRDTRSQWKTEATRIMTVLENSRGKGAEQASLGIQAALESSRSMPNATKNHIKGLVGRIVSVAFSISSPSPSSSSSPSSSGSPTPSEDPIRISDPVMRLLMTRLRGHILGRLTASSEKEKVKNASTATESLASLGLPEFVHRIGGMVDEMGRVGQLDRGAHGAWYEVIEGRCEEEDAGTGMTI